MSTHFWQRSYQRWKAAAKSSAATVLLTPSQMVLKLSLDMWWPASSFLSLGNKKKSAGARSGELGGCSSIWMPLAASQFLTEAAECKGALSQWNHQSPAAIYGRFCFKFFMKLAKAFTM